MASRMQRSILQQSVLSLESGLEAVITNEPRKKRVAVELDGGRIVLGAEDAHLLGRSLTQHAEELGVDPDTSEFPSEGST